jgi:hypothetical protein
VVFDEALVLAQGQVGSMAPGISAQRNPQIIFASSPPMSDSEVLHGLRDRAIDPEPGDRLFYAAWNNPPDTDITDRDAMYRVNPSLGYGRLTEESLMANRKLMSEADFRREHLGIPEQPVAATVGVVADEVWSELADPGSTIDSARRLALDVSPDRRFAAFGAAGRRADGRFHVEIVHHKPGTGWVLDLAKRSWGLRRIPIMIQTGSPAASFIDPLREAGVQVDEVSKADHARAVGQFLDACENDQLRHLGNVSLNSAVRGAVLQPSGDVEVWGRRSSKADISPLVAVTLALGGVPTGAGPSIYEERTLRTVG